MTTVKNIHLLYLLETSGLQLVVGLAAQTLILDLNLWVGLCRAERGGLHLVAGGRGLHVPPRAGVAARCQGGPPLHPAHLRLLTGARRLIRRYVVDDSTESW